MTRSRSAQPPETPRPLWMEEIQLLLSEFPPQDAAEGLGLTARVSEPEYDPRRNEISCRCLAPGQSPHVVVLEMDREFGELYADCTCADCTLDGYCPHLYAGLFRVLVELRDAGSSVSRQLAGETMGRQSGALALLDRYLAARQSQPTVETGSPAVRLVWRVACGTSGIGLTAYEQKRLKNGGWSKGRKVAWERLVRDSRLWTTPADRKVVSAIFEDRDNDGYSFYYSYRTHWEIDVFAALQHLVGHPLVFWEEEPRQPVAIGRGEPGLAVEPNDEGLRLVPAVNGEPATAYTGIYSVGEDGLVFLDQPRNRLVIVTGDVQQIEFLRNLYTEIALVPDDQQDELLSRLPALEAELPVRLPEQLLGGTFPADERHYLRLIRPSADVRFTTGTANVTAELRVRPAPEGAYCAPGEGPAELTGTQQGKRVRVQRELNDERVRARTLVEEIGLSQYPALDEWRWSLAEDDLLDLLDRLRSRPDDDPVVEWPDGGTMSVVGEITPSAMRVEIKDKKDWFGLDGYFEMDGRQYPLRELLEALRASRRYVQVGDGQWAAISQQFRERLAALDDVLHRNRGGLEFNVTATPVLTDIFDDEVALKASRQWKKAVERLERVADLNPEPPIALTAELRDYQLEGYRWLRRLAEWGVGGCLADDMGLGKTVQTLAVLVDRMEEGPALVVAPTSVGFNWVREAERFAPTLRPILYRETDRNEVLSSLGPGDLVVTSYGLLLRDIQKLKQVNWGTFVLDEAQFIKNSATKTARAAREVEAGWKVALTGTPLENHLGELWSIFRAVSPGLFGHWDRFRERFADPVEKHHDHARRQALTRTIRPFILRRTKSEVLSELPQRTEVLLTAELSKEERKLYEDARLWAVAHLADVAEDNGEDHRFQVLAALTRLRQFACHPRLVDRQWNKSSAKLDLLLETVDELREGRHRALVFSQFTQHLALIREALDERGIPYQYLDGQTTAKQRQERVDAFQRGEGDLFLISLKAGGTGLNLTAADYVIHMDPWWNPAVEDQATDRAHRIGQTRPVTVYRLVAQDTIEEQILALHADKRNLVAGVLEGSDQAAKLSTSELIDLIRTGGRDETNGRPTHKRRKVAARK